MNVQVFCWV